MSGIVGVLHLDGQPVSPGLIGRMLDTMAYRGPDGMGHWCENNIGLGHAMLHTTPESLLETQPLRVPELDLTLTLDGRLDNWLELRKALLAEGVTLRDRSDAELVLAAYVRWGDDCVDHLEGDFALAVWDGPRQRLFCARDVSGNKPLYYYRDDRLFAFASELPALLEIPGIELRTNTATVAEFLGMQFYTNDSTLWLDFKRLPPAHAMVYAGGKLNLWRFWQPDFGTELYYPQQQDYVEHYRELFLDTVRRLSRSHRPLGCEVSGGLDSSAIFAMAAGMESAGELLAPSLAGFTLDFSGQGEADEMSYARAVGRHLNKKIDEVPPTLRALSWYHDRARRRRGLPGAPNGVMSQGLFDRAANQGCRVIFNGTGGDEWLGAGRVCYAEEFAAQRWRNLWKLIRSDADAWGVRYALYALLRHGVAANFPRDFKDCCLSVRDYLARQAPAHSVLSPALRKQLLALKLARREKLPPDIHRRSQVREWERLNIDAGSFGKDSMEVLYAEAGLEMRCPFWTKNMIQFSISVPKRLLFGAVLDRALHRKSLGGYLPEKVLLRQDKARFSLTYEDVSTEIAEYFLEGGAAIRDEYVDVSTIESLRNEAPAGERPGANWRYWLLFCCGAALDGK